MFHFALNSVMILQCELKVFGLMKLKSYAKLETWVVVS